MISVLIPSRGRPEQLFLSVESIADTAANHWGIEIIIRTDEDDRSYDEQRAIADSVVNDGSLKWIVGPGLGYAGTRTYYYECAQASKGDWLVIWNDDALMELKNWDRRVEEYSGRFVVISPRTNMGPIQNQHVSEFPIVPRAWFTTLGYLSRNNHNDTYIGDVAVAAGVPIIDEPRIYVKHDRYDLTGNNNDETYRGRQYDPGYFTQATRQLIEEDAAKLHDVLTFAK